MEEVWREEKRTSEGKQKENMMEKEAKGWIKRGKKASRNRKKANEKRTKKL